ncbi:MAG TPA: hypothetical protein VF880_06795, partial [Actinomycetes bacterium]
MATAGGEPVARPGRFRRFRAAGQRDQVAGRERVAGAGDVGDLGDLGGHRPGPADGGGAHHHAVGAALDHRGAHPGGELAGGGRRVAPAGQGRRLVEVGEQGAGQLGSLQDRLTGQAGHQRPGGG